MAKLILSPLFLALIVLWPATILNLTRSETRGQRKLNRLALFMLAIVTAASLYPIASFIAPDMGAETASSARCPTDGIVVLSGGYTRSSNPDEESLSRETIRRVIAGSELFLRCQSPKLILSGSSVADGTGRDGELMRKLALQLSVPEERILMEQRSTTTRAHVRELAATGWFIPEADLAIVTSPWHLPRSMREFVRGFPKVYPVKAYHLGTPILRALTIWLPQAGALELSTTMIHEYIGMVWYELLGAFESDFPAPPR